MAAATPISLLSNPSASCAPSEPPRRDPTQHFPPKPFTANFYLTQPHSTPFPPSSPKPLTTLPASQHRPQPPPPGLHPDLRPPRPRPTRTRPCISPAPGARGPPPLTEARLARGVLHQLPQDQWEGARQAPLPSCAPRPRARPRLRLHRLLLSAARVGHCAPRSTRAPHLPRPPPKCGPELCDPPQQPIRAATAQAPSSSPRLPPSLPRPRTGPGILIIHEARPASPDRCRGLARPARRTGAAFWSVIG